MLDALQTPAACLFDLDGLLLDTEPLHGRAWAEAAAHFGAQLSPSQLLELRGRRRQDCASEVDSWLPSAVGNEALLEIQQPIARKLLPKAPAMPGAESLIQTCIHRGIPMALVTSSSRDAVEFKSAPHAWLSSIQERVYGDDPELNRGKPDPQPFVLAAHRLGTNADQCWALEDSKAGTTAALAAGCQVWVLDLTIQQNVLGRNPCKISTLDVVQKALLRTDD